MRHWTLEDIPWENFDRAKVDPEVIKIIKAACMVERHSFDYGKYLCSVFHDDPEFCAEALRWAEEEVQHGDALKRYAELADPEFDFNETFARFVEGHNIDVEAVKSIRGSRCAELVARCIVEVGTSSYYSALRDSVDEPVLREICQRIAGDEFRHYKMFYSNMKRYQKREGLGRFARMRLACGRIFESGDDELPYAYYCGSGASEPYRRGKFRRAYAGKTLSRYRYSHVQRGMGMALKAIGIKPQSRFGKLATLTAWMALRGYARTVARSAAYA